MLFSFSTKLILIYIPVRSKGVGLHSQTSSVCDIIFAERQTMTNLEITAEAFQGLLAQTCLSALLAIVVLFAAAKILKSTRAAFSGLWRKSRMGLAAVAILSVAMGLWADKTNLLRRIIHPGMSPAATVSEEDIRRGYRQENVTTNETPFSEMPTNAVEYAPWRLSGGRETDFPLNLGDFVFPYGTNIINRFRVLSGGMIETYPALNGPASICAAREYASLVPGVSRFWSADANGGAEKVLRWESVFANRDRTGEYSAEIRLSANGDFTTRSNALETVYRRVNPHDWDGDGLANEIDANPAAYDGDCFGPANILPEGANSNAYCSVSIVATGPDTLVTFTGDKPSNYPDPRFVAKSGMTNVVMILIGKTYAVSSDWPFEVVGVSDSETEIWRSRAAVRNVFVCRPVSFFASDGNPFLMNVWPSVLGGVFSWSSALCGCSVSGNGNVFSWNCPTDCTCCGCTVNGSYSYEGYWLPVTSCPCGCHYDGTGPKWMPTTLAASVSASFSKPEVIFEDAYENTPGNWVGRNSTRTRLNVVANGGMNGGTLSVVTSNLAKLTHSSGPDIPIAPVVIPAETQVSYAIVYEGAEASETMNDVCVVATFTENVTGEMLCSTSMLTSIEVALTAHLAAPSNSCMSRHVFGVNEWVHVAKTPADVNVAVCVDGDSILVGVDNDQFWCPWEGRRSELSFTSGNTVLTSYIQTCNPEPKAIHAEWNGGVGTNGCSGQVGMSLVVALYPMTVSFCGIYMQEIPDEDENCPRSGYFANGEIGRPWSHTAGAGAGIWTCVSSGNIWTGDRVGTGRTFPPPWSDGWKEWDIPVGWGTYEGGGYRIKGTSQTCPTTQRFEIDSQGTVTIRKFSHSIRRTIDNKIWLDGVLVYGEE